MLRHKKKTCLYCYAPLSGRRDAKTCSDRCRKRLQRVRMLLEQDIQEKIGSSHEVGRQVRLVPSASGFVMAKPAGSRRAK
jgi:hypothetical protein